MKIKFLLVLPFFIAGILTAARADWEQAYAIVGCKIVSSAGPTIEEGTILIRDGLIEALGPKAKITVPDSAQIIDGKGLTAYPGFIDAYASSFIEVPPESQPDMAEMFGDVAPAKRITGRNPHFMALDHIKFSDLDRDRCHARGILTVLFAPQQRLFSGQSALLNLNGKSPAGMVVRNPVALHVGFSGGRGAYPATTMGMMAFFKQTCLDAAYYRSAKERFMKMETGRRRPEYDPFLEALCPFVLDKKPIVFACDNQEDIKRALRLIKAESLNGWIAGAGEAWRVADQLKSAAAPPLLVSLRFIAPDMSLFKQMGKEAAEKAEKEIYPANAARLRQAGLEFALTSYGLRNEDDFLAQVRQAIKSGLSEEDALNALTRTPARYFGVDKILGSLEAGKIANILLSNGDVFKEGTRITQVFVDGLKFEVKDASPKKSEPPDAKGKAKPKTGQAPKTSDDGRTR